MADLLVTVVVVVVVVVVGVDFLQFLCCQAEKHEYMMVSFIIHDPNGKTPIHHQDSNSLESRR